MFLVQIGGTLPDLDVFVGNWIFNNEIQAMAFHRGFMHSILFAILAGVRYLGMLFFGCIIVGTRTGKTSRNEDKIVFNFNSYASTWIVFTGYGTQLFTPFSNYRVAFDNIAVADPFYTLPFLCV